jgi:uncharacterized membrane protein YdcZ (DUF606 family)
MKLYMMPRGVWIASHVLIILGLIFATICLHSVLPDRAAGFATAAIWCFSGGLCVVFVVFARVVAKK